MEIHMQRLLLSYPSQKIRGQVVASPETLVNSEWRGSINKTKLLPFLTKSWNLLQHMLLSKNWALIRGKTDLIFFFDSFVHEHHSKITEQVMLMVRDLSV